MRALRDLRELVRVAEQDEVPRRRPDRERIGERELPALVDEQRVDVLIELLAREQERRAGEQLRAPRRASPSFSSVFSTDPPALEAAAVARRTSSARGTRSPSSSAASSTSSRNLWIALWLSAVMPTRRPAFMSATAIRAPFHVFPEPGGPCTKR